MSECVCMRDRRASVCVCVSVFSFPREVLAERYLFTPPAELMELSGSDGLQERCVER